MNVCSDQREKRKREKLSVEEEKKIEYEREE